MLFHYGTPGVRLLSPQAVGAAVRCGVRLLVPDRPGYGGSSRRPGRRVADVVEDIVQLADALGWGRFATWGGSGGAPHALACAALLPDRVRRCASVVGPAPFDADRLDWFAGMSAGNVEEFTRALGGGSPPALAMTRSWGFPLARIEVPVSVWYGSADVLSPRGHAEWLIAHLPGAERRELPTGGHLLGDQDLDRLYAWLTAADT